MKQLTKEELKQGEGRPAALEVPEIHQPKGISDPFHPKTKKTLPCRCMRPECGDC